MNFLFDICTSVVAGCLSLNNLVSILCKATAHNYSKICSYSFVELVNGNRDSHKHFCLLEEVKYMGIKKKLCFISMRMI